MSYSLDFTDRVVLVTGGARGVGDGVVEAFLRAGASVEICGRTQPESVRSVDGRSPRFTSLDVRDEDQASAWVDGVVERHGRIDVVVNNAGGAPFAYFADASTRLTRKVVDLNFLASASIAHAAYPALRDSRGVLLSITSVSARRPSPGTAAYGAAKAALESLTRSLAVEWAPDVRVNALSCGLVATEGSADHYGDAEQFAAIEATIPMGRMATPLEVGQACVLLASPLASYVTGAVVPVDGGGEWPAFLQHAPRPEVAPRSRRPGGGH